MSRKLSTGFIIAVAFGLLSATAPANATLIQWKLVDVAEISNPDVTFTGFFDYNTARGPLPDYSITMSVGGLPSFTWSLANSRANAGRNGDPLFVRAIANPQEELELDGNHPLDGSVSTIPLLSGFGGLALSYFEASSLSPESGDLTLSGSLTDVSAVPLPAALPLFGSAVLALGAFACWRRRKVLA